MFQRYKTFLFDLDETLLDNPQMARTAYDICTKIRPELFLGTKEQKDDMLYVMFGGMVEYRSERFLAFCRKWGWEEKPTKESSIWQEWFMQYSKNAVPFSWTVEMLTYLKHRGAKLGVVTNGRAIYQRTKLEASGLITFFDQITISGDFGISKPDPRIYQTTMEILHADPETTLFVGDTPNTDIAGAYAAKIDSLYLDKGIPEPLATYVAKDTRVLIEG